MLRIARKVDFLETKAYSTFFYIAYNWQKLVILCCEWAINI